MSQKRRNWIDWTELNSAHDLSTRLYDPTRLTDDLIIIPLKSPSWARSGCLSIVARSSRAKQTTLRVLLCGRVSPRRTPFHDRLGASLLSTSALRAPATGAGGPAQQQADTQTHWQFARLTARIEGIAAAWNAASLQFQFQYYFYNASTQIRWGCMGARAECNQRGAVGEDNARESRSDLMNFVVTLVPTIAIGFDDLWQRVDSQRQQAAAHQERLKNNARIARFAALQTQLTHRLLAIAAHLHLLVSALRSSGIRVEEEELREWLEELREEIGVCGGNGGGGGGNGGGRMRGKLGEL
ncbi:hypothetical protein C8J57DRAFT_1703559 [Mycena rebaudengoi]|nr:hypothetical protein C8J57DRAFT_1703559 [Mycena rebaudengoi]